MSTILNSKQQKRLHRQRLRQRAFQMKSMYLMILIPLIFIIIFNYVPMYGVIISFKKFSFRHGIGGSPWYGFGHFERLFKDVLFKRALTNTLTLSITRLLITFPAPILFALLLNEIKNAKFKKLTQTISYIPHFMSWVVVGQFVYQVLSPEYGVINTLLTSLGFESIYFMSNKEMFVPVVIITYLWQGIGWGSIVYLAALSSVDPQLYEAAELDGANRYHKMIYVTLPALAPIVTIQLIMAVGGIMNNGLDPILNLSNGMLTERSLTIEYYSYMQGLENAKYDYAAAIGLFQTVIGFILLLTVNAITKRINEYGIW